MTRRKGERTDRHRNLSHPFQVCLAGSGGGAGMAVMERWAAWFDHETTRAGRDGMCWCFCRPDVADAFAQDFGGERVDRPVQIHSLAVDLPDCSEVLRRSKAAWIGMEIVTGGRVFGQSAPLQGAEAVPYSTFSDPADIARCDAALTRAWAIVEDDIAEPDRDLQKVRLAYIVASFFLVAANGDDLVRRTVERFRQPRRGGDFASEFGGPDSYKHVLSGLRR